MANQNKDTIYIDVDDEITAVIDKIQTSPSKIIALVLPKRAPMFQSVVNMKLLKRAAADHKKNLVLITSDQSVLPLAGVVGMHVAKTLQSRPEVPEAPALSDEPVGVDEPEPDESAASTTEDESIEVDDDAAVGVATDEATDKQPKAKAGYNKRLKVPNFEQFRNRLFLGGLALVLVVSGLIYALVVMPKAKIVVKTNNQNVDTNLTIIGKLSAKEADLQQLIVPATAKEYKKTDSLKAPATGKKDVGTKAKGSVTLTLLDCSKDEVSIPAGTTLTNGNLNFVTQADVLLKSVKIGNKCHNSDFKDFSTATLNVLASQPGDTYNVSARAYTVAGFSNVSGAGTAMSGGVSKVVTVVSQDDINNAKQKLIDGNKDAAAKAVSDLLKGEGYLPIPDTLNASEPLVVASPNVDDEAGEVTVNVTLSYTLSGVKQDALVSLLEADIKKHIDTTKQTILDDGLSAAQIRVTDKAQNGDVTFTLASTALAGVQQDANSIKQSVVGKKKGDVEAIVGARPGVEGVDVSYSPFWVYKTPKATKKITVVFQQSNGSAKR